MVLKRMLGGGLEKASKKMTSKMGNNGDIYMFLLGIMMLLLKTLMVQWSYNNIWPKLMINSGQDINKFKPLNFHESFLLVVLFMFL